MNKYEYKVQGVDYEVEIEEVEGNIAKVKVNGISFEVELKQPINAATAISHPRPVTPPVAAATTPKPAVAAAPKALFFPGGEGEQTGIENVFGADENGTVTIYNLAGQRLNKLEKGINIVNGRKVLVK